MKKSILLVLVIAMLGGIFEVGAQNENVFKILPDAEFSYSYNEEGRSGTGVWYIGKSADEFTLLYATGTEIVLRSKHCSSYNRIERKITKSNGIIFNGVERRVRRTYQNSYTLTIYLTNY